MDDNSEAKTAPQIERPVNMRELRALVSRSDFWRPDTVPTKLRLVDGNLRAGSNKWGRIQIYSTARLEDDRVVKLAMSKRNAAGLLQLIDEQGIDERQLHTCILEVVKTGRGLDTAYRWQLVGQVTAEEVAIDAAKGPGNRKDPSGKPSESSPGAAQNLNARAPAGA